MKKIRVSMIGLNHAGFDYHLPGIASFEDVDLSVCDISPEALARARDTYNIPEAKCYTDYLEMFEREDPDAVYVMMAQYAYKDKPWAPGAYFKAVDTVLSQRRHILVEKPLAMTCAEAAPLVEAAEKAGVINMVSLNRRFYPLTEHCRKEAEKYGPIHTVHCNFYKSGWPSHKDTLEPLVSDMIHAIDLARFLMGCEDVVSLAPAMAKLSDDLGPTAYHALMTFPNGRVATFSSSIRAGARRELCQMHSSGLSAYIESDPDAVERCLQKATLFRNIHKPYDEPLMPERLTCNEVAGTDAEMTLRGFSRADRYFVDCVRDGVTPHCSFADGYKTIECCEKILNSETLVCDIEK